MANAIEDALNRASPEQRIRAQQVIEEARHNIKLVSMQEHITPADADSAAKNAQAIEDAKRTIPFDTMQEVETIAPPLPTPTNKTYYSSNVVELHPTTRENIERIQQGEGNNYMQGNAVDRAMDRQPQEIHPNEQQQQQALGR